MFEIKRELTLKEFRSMVKECGGIKRTKHSFDRTNREESFLNEKIYKIFSVNKGHKNGPELHILTNNAKIVILNEITLRYITILSARPGQIKRYFQNKEVILQSVIDNSIRNVNLGKNRI